MAALSQEQIAAYLERISFPSSGLPIDTESVNHLALLQRYTLVTIPFENLSLHYSKHHRLSLDIDDLFEKIVTNRRGGYCMENNKLFCALLCSLGFRAYATGARISYRVRGRSDNGFAGWSHQVSIVTIQNTRYMVDIGFGANGPVQPLPLVHNEPTTLINPAVCRLEYRRLEQNTDSAQRSWVYSFKLDNQADWFDAYTFTEVEFFSDDFEVMNQSTMLSRQSAFTQKVIAQKMLVSEDWSEIIGTIVLVDKTLKRRIRGENEVLEELQSEEQRFSALEKWFGIRICNKDKKYIKFLVSEIV